MLAEASDTHHMIGNPQGQMDDESINSVYYASGKLCWNLKDLLLCVSIPVVNKPAVEAARLLSAHIDASAFLEMKLLR